MSTQKIQEGDIVRDKYNEHEFLVTKVERNSFVLADPIIPSFGYKAEVTISPLYEYVRTLSKEEFEEVINRVV